MLTHVYLEEIALLFWTMIDQYRLLDMTQPSCFGAVLADAYEYAP